MAPECKCGNQMEETEDGIVYPDCVTVVYKCNDCGRTVEIEFHPINETWTEPVEED